MDKEEFLAAIHQIPYWVKGGDDLLKFCKHIQYRLFQAQDVLHWYHMNAKISDDQIHEVNEIHRKYDNWKNNDTSEFPPFWKVFDNEEE